MPKGHGVLKEIWHLWGSWVEESGASKIIGLHWHVGEEQEHQNNHHPPVHLTEIGPSIWFLQIEACGGRRVSAQTTRRAILTSFITYSWHTELHLPGKWEAAAKKQLSSIIYVDTSAVATHPSQTKRKSQIRVSKCNARSISRGSDGETGYKKR